MPKAKRKRIGVKQVSKASKPILQNSTSTALGNFAPAASEGKEGQMSVRLVNGVVKLFVKFRGNWYSISLS